MKIVCLLCLFLAACSSSKVENRWMQENGKIKILSTTAMVNDLVMEVGGNLVDPLVLIQGQLDPHSYELVKGDDEKFARADLIFYVGLNMEHGPSLKQLLVKSPKAVSLGDSICKEDPSLILSDRGQVDPHIWMDISLWQRAIPFIVQALQQVDPVHAEEYRGRGEALALKMMQAHLEVKQQMQNIPRSSRYLVTSHDAFNYFTRAYLAEPEETDFASWKVRFVAPEGLAPEGQIGIKEIQKIMSHIKAHDIQVLFFESNVSKDSIKKILQCGENLHIAKEPLYGDAMGAPGTEAGTYLGMIRSNARVIASNLGEKT